MKSPISHRRFHQQRFAVPQCSGSTFKKGAETPRIVRIALFIFMGQFHGDTAYVTGVKNLFFAATEREGLFLTRGTAPHIRECRIGAGKGVMFEERVLTSAMGALGK